MATAQVLLGYDKEGRPVYGTPGMTSHRVVSQTPPDAVAGTYGDGRQVETQDDGNTVSPAGSVATEGPDQNFAALIDLMKSTDAKNRKIIEEFIGSSLPALEQAVDDANKGDRIALERLKHSYSQFEQLIPPEYRGDALTDPEDEARQQEAYDRQVGAADNFKEWFNPEMTAQEQYIVETNRLSEEQDRRAAMDAALADLGARGARSGGAEITAMLGAQQQTSQNRAIQDLGALAQAQQRAFNARGAYADASGMAAGTATNMRNASDVMHRFNQELGSRYDQWSANYKADQQAAAEGRTDKTYAAERGTTDAAMTRAAGLWDAGAQGAAMQTGQNTQGAQGIAGGIKTWLGAEQAQNAIDALNQGGGNESSTTDDIFSILDPLNIGGATKPAANKVEEWWD